MSDASFHTDWTWYHDGEGDEGQPRSARELATFGFATALRVLSILERHGILLADTVSWSVGSSPERPRPADGSWPLRGTVADLDPESLTEELLPRLAELDPPARSGVDTLTFRGPFRLAQPDGGTVLLPDAVGLRVFPDHDTSMVVLDTTTDVWMPRNRFGDPQPELHELNAPRLAACLAEITAELGWEFEPDDDPKPYVQPSGNGLDNGMFYDRRSLVYTASAPENPFPAAVPADSPVGRLLAVAPNARPVPGSAEAIDAWGRWLRRRITTAASVVPGTAAEAADPHVTEPEPFGAPGEYAQIETVDGTRGSLPAEEVVRRVTEVLVDDGWDVALQPAAGPRVEATARHHGCEIAVTAWSTVPRFALRGSTPRIRLYPPRVWERPPRAVSPEQVSPGWVLCYECDGWGTCPVCEGRGWFPNGERCPNCDHTGGSRGGLCPICRGEGELSVDRLSPHQREAYPELRNT